MHKEKKIYLFAATLIVLNILDAHATCLIGLEANPLINYFQSLSACSFPAAIIAAKAVAIFFILILAAALIKIERKRNRMFIGFGIVALYILVAIYGTTVATSYAAYILFKT